MTTIDALNNELKLWKQQARKWERKFKAEHYKAMAAKQALADERTARTRLISKRLAGETTKRAALERQNEALRAALDIAGVTPPEDDSARRAAG